MHSITNIITGRIAACTTQAFRKVWGGCVGLDKIIYLTLKSNNVYQIVRRVLDVIQIEGNSCLLYRDDNLADMKNYGCLVLLSVSLWLVELPGWLFCFADRHGIIKVERSNTSISSFNVTTIAYSSNNVVCCRSNPATNDWIPSSETVLYIKPETLFDCSEFRLLNSVTWMDEWVNVM